MYRNLDEIPLGVISNTSTPSTSDASSAESDIVAELVGMVERLNTARSREVNLYEDASATSQRSQHAGQPPVPHTHDSQAVEVSREKVIVGHFCHFTIRRLGEIMEGSPQKQQVIALLKEHITSMWVHWVDGHLSRHKMLVSIACYVRDSGPLPSRFDVIKEFKEWYEVESQRHDVLLEGAKAEPLEQHFQNADF